MRLARLPGGEPEIFVTIQGEGPSAGVPSAFVRLALCNLHCGWCDTKYTWDWEHFDPQAEIVRVGNAEVVERVTSTGARNVVFTGGEPLLQQYDIAVVATALAGHGRRIEVETNGTIVPLEALSTHVAQWNVSPKLANSGNTEAERDAGEAMDWFAARENTFFKFVVGEPGDIDEVKTLAARYGLAPERILLMPEGTNSKTLSDRSPWIVEACVAGGYRFSTRLHVLLWGDERGR